MLIDTYLPEYDFNEKHSIVIAADSQRTFAKMLVTTLSPDLVSKFLLAVRGLSPKQKTIGEFGIGAFAKLGETAGEEIVFGIISNNGVFSSCRRCTAEEFVQPNNSVIKSVINFRCDPFGESAIVSTETRILCGNRRLKKVFTLYWFMVKPFSGLLRRRMLRQLKQSIERDA